MIERMITGTQRKQHNGRIFASSIGLWRKLHMYFSVFYTSSIIEIFNFIFVYIGNEIVLRDL